MKDLGQLAELPRTLGDQSPPTGSRLTLEVCRGRTAFPRRPVSEKRFFLGSGAQCDLQLGGKGLPNVHSYIQYRGRHAWIEPIAQEPPLKLNGELTEGEWLRDGDLIEIGSFQLRATLDTLDTDETWLVHEFPEVADCLEQLEAEIPFDLQSLSAEELVDLLASEQEFVDRFDEDRHAGAMALQQTLRQRQLPQLREIDRPQRHVIPALPHQIRDITAMLAASNEGEDYFEELERLCDELTEFSNALERRSEGVSIREATYVTAANTLLTAQKQLLVQLEEFANKVQRSATQPPAPQPSSRAIA